ncbi:MAG: histidine kinase [Spirochaetales bacterium]|nr:histidine kinase [Spirochaetales bacterium]
MKHKLRNRIVGNSIIIILILSVVTLYTAFSSLSLARSIELLLQNNLFLKEKIRKNLENTQNNLTGYLMAKNSESLREYIHYSSNLYSQIERLNKDIKKDEQFLLEKNLASLLVKYLEASERAVNAKRGRDVGTYVSQYEETKKIEGLIQFLLVQMNAMYLNAGLQAFLGYRSNLTTILIINLFLILIAFMLSTIFTVRYSFIITEPLERLSETVEAVERSNYNYELPPYEEDDEIGTLNYAFNRMQKSIRNAFDELNRKSELERKLLEEQMHVMEYEHKLKEAELLALQTQINPHFLYNTLSAGWQLALSEQDETTAEFLEKLSEFIRYVLRPTNRFVLVSEEIECARKYIWLLQLRFKNRYKFELNIEEEALSYETPALILQPLIENAVVHGLHDLEQGGTVSISVRVQHPYLDLSVGDTGKGMETEEIEKVLNAAQSETPPNFNRIGLYNVVRRVILATSGQGVVAITAHPGGGTFVQIRLPLE